MMLLTLFRLLVINPPIFVNGLSISRRQGDDLAVQSPFQQLSQSAYNEQLTHPRNDLVTLDLLPADYVPPEQLSSSGKKKLGINCRGHFWCPWISGDGFQYISLLLGGIQADLPDETMYYHTESESITEMPLACMLDVFDDGGYCVTLSGNIPKTGVSGKLIKTKMQALLDHRCFSCGEVPFSDDNDPDTMGTLVVNWKKPAMCRHKEDWFNRRPACVPDIVPIPPGMAE